MTTPTQDRSLRAFNYCAFVSSGSYATIHRIRVRRGGDALVAKDVHVDRFITALREGLEEDDALERARRTS